MFGRRRAFLPRALLFIAIGFLIASLVGSAGSAGTALAAIVFLPLLLLKMLFIFFIFGTMMRFAFGGRGHWHGGDEHRPEPTEAEREWAEAQQTARDEVDEMFPDPQD